MGNKSSSWLKSVNLDQNVSVEDAFRIWDKFDADDNGFLDKSEFRKFAAEWCEARGITDVAAKTDALWAHFDTDKDGKISRDEILGRGRPATVPKPTPKTATTTTTSAATATSTRSATTTTAATETKRDTHTTATTTAATTATTAHAADSKTSGGVVRYEIRYAPADLQNRFAAAIAKMQENPVAGKNSSEFFRLAGYHGWPSQYCAHGNETFPTWHRGYLLAFEKALQAADKANGHDGHIGLPYWDWTDLKGPSGNEPFPNILNDARLAQLPQNFFQEKPTSGLAKPFKHNRNIAQQLLNAGVSKMAADALIGNPSYIRFASTQGGAVSLEDSHNSVHVCVGAPMSSVSTAAFDATFWLHHCNVDRLFQKYLSLTPNALNDARTTAHAEAEQGSTAENLFEKALFPFTHPTTGKPFMPADAFSLNGLNYTYDKLPPDPENVNTQLNQLPSFAVFPKINIRDLKLETYQLHVFLIGGEYTLPALSADPDTFHEQKNYAGLGAIFGGKEDCENCATRVPFSVRVDITAALNATDLSRYDIELGVIAIDSQGEPHALADTPVPKPEIQGPLFEDYKHDVPTKGTDMRSKGEIRALQKYLQRYNLFCGDANGVWDEKLDQAVKAFQHSVGMAANGVVCKTTKKYMIAPRFDTKIKHDVTPRKRGTNVTYWVGTSPANMDRAQVLHDIQQACELWAPSGVTFTRIDSWDTCDVEILWHDQHYHATLAKTGQEDVKVSKEEIESNAAFDGAGGQLAHSGFDFLHLDIGETWITSDTKKTRNSQFILYNVVAHELGHVLGLEHSDSPRDLMSPFYDDKHTTLSANDGKVLHGLYPSHG